MEVPPFSCTFSLIYNSMRLEIVSNEQNAVVSGIFSILLNTLPICPASMLLFVNEVSDT